jgi:class 3 adenylate cyclase
MNVRVWLRGLGLGRYEEKFLENKIDFDVLADLTDGDLRELGVPLGDGRRLLRAIAELGAQQPRTAQAQPRPAALAPAQSFAQLDSAERRPITLMFCDLVGSTELAAALDVEDWRNLVNTYLDEASKAVIRLDGHVLKRLGDGLMAVFGYPRAQENDAERAVRAALGVQQALGEVNVRNKAVGAPQLAVRVGLESGPVVVDDTGDVFGEPPSQGLDEASLQSALARLADSGLLFVDGIPPEVTYSFKHALIQDAAYDSLLRSRRQALHKHAAAALIAAQSEPEAIAHHFTAAGAKSLAIEWWGNAGEDALRRSAFKEAMAHLGKAIALADEAEREAPAEAKDPVLSDRRLRLHTDYGHAAMWLKGFAADEMSAAYARAGQFAGPTDQAAPRFVAYYAECLTSFMRGEHRQAHAEAEAFLREAEAEGRPREAGVGRRVLGFVSLLLGDLESARKALKRTLSDYVHERDRETLFRFGNDTRVSATNFLALTEWHLGELERARQLSEESNRCAAELGHAASIASALFFKTVLESRRGDILATRLTVEALLALTEELNLKTYTDLVRYTRTGFGASKAIRTRARLGSRRRWRPILLKATRAARLRSTACWQSLRPCGWIWIACSRQSTPGWRSRRRRGSITLIRIFIVFVATCC